MFDLKRLVARAAEARTSSSYHQQSIGNGLEVEYRQLIAEQFRRWGLDPACVSVEGTRIGTAPDGFDVFSAMVRLHAWERRTAMRLLLGLPLLEAKVRKAVRATWLAEFSHFGGLWLHASEALHASEGADELRTALVDLVG